jgi:hypothetical protein
MYGAKSIDSAEHSDTLNGAMAGLLIVDQDRVQVRARVTT